MEKPVRVEVERVVTNTVEKIIEKPVEVEVEKIVTNVVEKIVEKPVRVEIEKIVTNTVEKVVEKNVHDFSEEERLRGEVAASVKKSDALEAKNTFLSNDNEKLKQELAEMRERCQRLERLIPKGQAPKRGQGARPTSHPSRPTMTARRALPCLTGRCMWMTNAISYMRTRPMSSWTAQTISSAWWPWEMSL